MVLLLPEKATILAPRLTGNTANTPGSPVDDSGHAPTGPLYVGGDLVPAAVASGCAPSTERLGPQQGPHNGGGPTDWSDHPS